MVFFRGMPGHQVEQLRGRIQDLVREFVGGLRTEAPSEVWGQSPGKGLGTKSLTNPLIQSRKDARSVLRVPGVLSGNFFLACSDKTRKHFLY